MPNVFRLAPHDAKMGLLSPYLAQRIERQQPARRGGGAVPRADRQGLGQQRSKRLFDPLAEPLPLEEQPVFESRITQADAVE